MKLTGIVQNKRVDLAGKPDCVAVYIFESRQRLFVDLAPDVWETTNIGDRIEFEITNLGGGSRDIT